MGELTGRWALARTVTDRRADVTGTVVGTLEVVAEPGRTTWYETGTLTWAGRTTPVSRTTYLADGWMHFADGRPFHPWRPGEDVVHPCGHDTYVGRIDVGPGTLRTVWRVTGPAKDQLLVTDLVRAS